MSSEQKIADMQERIRRWVDVSEAKGRFGTLEGLETDIEALEEELQALFPARQAGEDPMESLREQAMFRTVLESMIEGVVVSDMQGHLLVFNAAARELLGQDRAEAEQESWSEQYGFFHLDGKTLYQSQELPLSRAMGGESVYGEELLVRAPSRSEDVYIKSSARPLWNDDGEQLGGVVVFHDITESKGVEKVLREATSQAEAASRIKSEFLANMSHEIRTPLTAVLGFADLLLDPNLGESNRLNYIQAIRRNGQHLLELINDILDLSKLQADKVQIDREDFSLQQLLHEVVSVMQVRACEKGLNFRVVYDTPIPVHIHNDAMRIRQVLFNLVSNAIKFTPHGSVTLHCSCLDPGRESSRLELAVADTGIGITETEIEALFQPFKQANLSTSRQYGGTGLGLAICRALSEALDGEIQVDSQPDEGSVFRLVLRQPLDAGTEMVGEHYQSLEDIEQAPAHHSDTSHNLSGRILLAEDGHDNQLLISTVLMRQGLEVDIAEDGEQAVDKAMQALAEQRSYDLVLMDMQMPRLDGYGATAKLRHKGYSGPVVALTAHAMAGERERCLAAGCDEYLTKPIDRPALLSAVKSYLGRTPDAEAQPEAADKLASRNTGASNGPIHSTYANDPDMQELVKGFVGRLPQIVQDIQAAHDADDTERLCRLAHQLKGSAGGYGFLPVSQTAAALEGATRQPESTEELASALEQLQQICKRVELANKG